MNKLSYLIVFTIFIFQVSFRALAAEPPLVINGTAVAKNSIVDITVPVMGSAKDENTFVPITVIRGTKPGPVLAAVAGVHGYEYNSILAMERWLKTLDPTTLSGAIIAVRVAHIPAFVSRSIYVNPNDRKNLNRSFPGALDGTQTERIAWAISQHVVAHADMLLDLHSGDGAEWLAPFTGVYGGPLSTDYPLAMRVAEGFRFPNIVTYSMNSQTQVDTRRSLNRQGVAQRIPTVLVEIGENGSTLKSHVDAMIAGLDNTLALLNMRDSTVTPELAGNPRYFKGTTSVPVSSDGLWFPKHTEGRFVEQGEALGVLKDYFGNTIETVRAPQSGYALYGLMGPAIRKGESVMTIAFPVAD